MLLSGKIADSLKYTAEEAFQIHGQHGDSFTKLELNKMKQENVTASLAHLTDQQELLHARLADFRHNQNGTAFRNGRAQGWMR